MKLELICKGYYPKTKKETTYSMELTIADENFEYINDMFKNNELNSENYNYIINTAIRDFSWLRNIVFKKVTALNIKKSHIFLVMLEWQTEDDNGLDYYLYYEYAAAKKKYQALIKDEKSPDISWVGSEAFNKTGKMNEGFELEYTKATREEKNLCWKVSETNRNRYSLITLTKVEII